MNRLNKLLREAFQAGRRQALNEQGFDLYSMPDPGRYTFPQSSPDPRPTPLGPSRPQPGPLRPTRTNSPLFDPLPPEWNSPYAFPDGGTIVNSPSGWVVVTPDGIVRFYYDNGRWVPTSG